MSAFENIADMSDLKEYLDDKGRLSNCLYLSHYTNYSKLLSILKSKHLYLSTAENMNDQLEYSNGDLSVWNRLFFSSFIMNKKENIGMWSVYAQPWDDGIKISVPVSSITQMIGDTTLLQIVNSDESLSGDYVDVDEHLKLFLSAVAYTNCESRESTSEEELLTWNTVKNKIIKKPSKEKTLTGYIKDAAWSYEQEIRLKAIFDNRVNYHRLAINIESIIPSFRIATGPLFKGSLSQRLLNDLENYDETKYHFDNSIFLNRFIL